MFKVEIKFRTNNMKQSDIEEICKRTDEIFVKEDLICDKTVPGERIYYDKGRKQDYGRFWAAIFSLKKSTDLVAKMQECFWYNGSSKENLISDFLSR